MRAYVKMWSSLLRAGFNKIIVNLQRVAKIDSVGLGALVLMQCRTHGGKAVLLHLNSSNVGNFNELKLVAEFEMFDDEQDATDSFSPDRRKLSTTS